MRRLVTLFVVCVSAIPLPAKAEAVKLEGDAAALTLVVDGAARSVVVTAIAKRFTMQMSGIPIGDEIVSGRFTGTLGTVLKKLLPDNGFVIAYEGGRPARIVFTGKGTGSVAADPGFVPPFTSPPINNGVVDPNSAPPPASDL